MGADREWMDAGSCLRRADLPWTSDISSMTATEATIQTAAMTEVCSTCPVLARCAMYALDFNVCGGFWAGTNRENSGSARKLATPTDGVQGTLPGLGPVAA